MAYGHAERNLAVIRQLEAETSQFLASLHGHDQVPSEDIAERVPSQPDHGADERLSA